MRKNIYLVYAILLGITLGLWLLAKPDISTIFRFPLVSLTQISALFAVCLLSLNFLLASRFKFLENLFGGLDKVYKMHQNTGKYAFVLMTAHPFFLALSALPTPEVLKYYFFSFSDSTLIFGRVSLFLFVTLIILTLVIKLPYHIWRRTHQFMVVPLIFAALHVVSISSDVSVFMPLRYWILGLLTISLVLYVYKVFLYPFLANKKTYKITKLNSLGAINEIILSPTHSQLNYEPGQFVFAVFSSQKVSKEEHPFSLSSSPTENFLRLSIKKSGDFTNKLANLKAKEIVTFYGPYGQFGKHALSTSKDLVFIAGGIGVTPFLSIIGYIKDKKIDKKFDMYYVYSNEKEGVYKKELEGKINKTKGRLITHISEKSGRITAEIIAKESGNITKKLILICGPKAMMVSLSEQFKKLGVKDRNVIFEDFDLKG